MAELEEGEIEEGELEGELGPGKGVAVVIYSALDTCGSHHCKPMLRRSGQPSTEFFDRLPAAVPGALATAKEPPPPPPPPAKRTPPREQLRAPRHDGRHAAAAAATAASLLGSAPAPNQLGSCTAHARTLLHLPALQGAILCRPAGRQRLERAPAGRRRQEEEEEVGGRLCRHLWQGGEQGAREWGAATMELSRPAVWQLRLSQGGRGAALMAMACFPRLLSAPGRVLAAPAHCAGLCRG